MTNSEHEKYAASCKKVWVMYTLAVACLIAILVFIVAADSEEMLFYGLMTAAASYVFRPNEAFIEGAVKKLFGIDPPADKNDESA